MGWEKFRFRWWGVVLGFIVMVFFALITVNVLRFIPLAGPFVGGLAAGYTGGKDALSGALAGISAGILGALAVSADFLMNLGYLRAAVPAIPEIAGILFLGLALIYFPVLAFIGGAIGAVLRR